MKTLDDYMNPLDPTECDPRTYVSLALREFSGGRISKDEIDVIRASPHATEIAISALTQDTFEYFVENYGHQFKTIIFWKCSLIGSLRAIEQLDTVEYIVYYWNQRAEHLWDFSKTRALKGFSFDDFTNMHDISEIAGAPALEELQFGNRVWSKYILNTLEPIKACTALKRLAFSAKKIGDGKIEPLARLKQLEQLSFSPRLFTTQQVAWLRAHLPDTVVSKVLTACWTFDEPLNFSGMHKDTVIVGKGKPFLSSVNDKARISRYVEQFDAMRQWFSEHPQASPDDYPQAA